MARAYIYGDSLLKATMPDEQFHYHFHLPEVMERLKNGIAITKIRVVFKENDVRNYEIAEGYQARMASDLLISFLEASQKNKKANGDLSDEDF